MHLRSCKRPTASQKNESKTVGMKEAAAAAAAADTHVIYGTSSLPLQPSECDLLRMLINKRIALAQTAGARRRSAWFPPAGGKAAAGTSGDDAESGPVLSVTCAVDRSESGNLFSRGWQAMGCSRAFKIEVHGLGMCRLLCRWIKRGEIDGLPRKGVQIAFQLLLAGEPLQPPSKMQADLEIKIAECSNFGNVLCADRCSLAADAASRRLRFNDWEKERRRVKRVQELGAGMYTTEERLQGSGEKGRGKERPYVWPDGIRFTKLTLMRGCARGTVSLGADRDEVHAAKSVDVQRAGHGEAGIPVTSRSKERALTKLIRARERAAVGEWKAEREVFTSQQQGWPEDYTAIKERLQSLQQAMVVPGLGGG